MKMLIAYDGSDFSNAIIADLTRAGLPEEGEARVVTVAEGRVEREIGWTPSAGGMEAAPPEFRAVAEKGVRRFLDVFPNWNTEAEIRVGSPSREIMNAADEFSADLIVVGSHGASMVERALLGSVSHKVVAEAHRSVRVARAAVGHGGQPVQLVIGVDGSPHAEAAVREVCRRRWPTGSRALVVTGYGALYVPALLSEVEAQIHEVQAESVAALTNAGLIVTGDAVEGDPARALVAVARDVNADCVFVGATGLSAVGRFFLGSVSLSAATHAGCSVEVVRSLGA